MLSKEYCDYTKRKSKKLSGYLSMAAQSKAKKILRFTFLGWLFLYSRTLSTVLFNSKQRKKDIAITLNEKVRN